MVPPHIHTPTHHLPPHTVLSLARKAYLSLCRWKATDLHLPRFPASLVARVWACDLILANETQGEVNLEPLEKNFPSWLCESVMLQWLHKRCGANLEQSIPLNSLLDEMQWSLLLQCFVMCSQGHCNWYYSFHVWLGSKAQGILSNVYLFFSQFFFSHCWLHYYQAPSSGPRQV